MTGEEDEVAVFTAHCVLFAFESPEGATRNFPPPPL